LQQVRRTDGTRGQHDLAQTAGDLFGTAPLVFDADRAVTLDEYAARVGLGHNREVRPRARRS
jgi:hypothetical protein